MSTQGLRTKLVPFAWALPVLLALAGLVLLVATLAPPAPPPPLRIATGPWIGYEPLVLARENDWLGPHLRLVETLSNTETNQALRDGSADLAGVTLDEALRLRSDGVPIRIIAVLSDSRGADALVAREGIAGLADLRGRRVLVEDTAVGYFLLQSALKSVGLDRSDVRQVQVQSSYLPARWRAGDAEAAVAYEPLLTELLEQGGQVLFSTRDHPGLVLDVLVARQRVLDERRPDVVATLRAWDRAVAAFAQPQSLPLEVLTADGRQTPAQYREALAGVGLFDLAQARDWLQGRPSRLDQAIESLAEVLRDGALGPDLRVDPGIVDAGPLREAAGAPGGEGAP